MTEKTLTLKGEIVERMEAVAQQQGRSIEAVLSDVFPPQTVVIASEFGRALVKAMADVEWVIDDPDLSTNSRDNYQEARYQEWQRSQLDQQDD